MKQFYNDFIAPFISQPCFLWFLAGMGFCILLYLILILISCRRRPIRVFRDESGHASVSRKALKDLIHIACDRIGTPTKPKIEFVPKRGRLDLNLKIKLYEGQRLSELRNQLRRNVIRTFEEAHGIRLGDINLIVNGFKKGGPQAPTIDFDEEAEVLQPEYSANPETNQAETGKTTEGTPPILGEELDKPSETPEPVDTSNRETSSTPKKKRSLFAWGSKKKDPPKEETAPKDQDEEGAEEEPHNTEKM